MEKLHDLNPKPHENVITFSGSMLFGLFFGAITWSSHHLDSFPSLGTGSPWHY